MRNRALVLNRSNRLGMHLIVLMQVLFQQLGSLSLLKSLPTGVRSVDTITNNRLWSRRITVNFCLRESAGPSEQEPKKIWTKRNVTSTSSSSAYTASAPTESFFIPSGLCAVYKPKDWTSNDVVSKIRGMLLYEIRHRMPKKKYNIKVGHGGTLDPLAEGVLVLGVGSGTKLLGDYLAGSKGYLAEALLGTEMDTLDSTGTAVREAPWEHVTQHDLLSALSAFRGDILQLPPMHSALKRDGKKLYELAREGITVERERRPVTVYDLQLAESFISTSPSVSSEKSEALLSATTTTTSTAMVLPKFALSVECSGGFYVRSLIADVATAVGSAGHMTGLVRTKQGQFTIDDCLTSDKWNVEDICRHIVKSSAVAGIPAENMQNAIILAEKSRRRY